MVQESSDRPARKLPKFAEVSVVCDMEAVRGSDSGLAVQLCQDMETGRILVRAINEGGFSCTEVDLLDLLSWLDRASPGSVDIDSIASALTARNRNARYEAID